jgi:hypothetical protein
MTNRKEIIILISGILAYLSLFVLNLRFYVDISTFLDSSDQILNIILTEKFSFFANRWGFFINQLIPISVIKLNGDLSLILKSYAVSTLFVSFLLFLFTFFILKNREGAILLLMLNTFGLSECYASKHWTIFMGMQYLIVLYLWMGLNTTSRLQFIRPIAIVWITFLLINTHNLFFLLVPVLMIYGYLVKEIPKKRFYTFIRLFFLLLILRSLLFPASNYELARYLGIIISLLDPIEFAQAGAMKFFINRLVNGFYLIPLIMLGFLFFKWLSISFKKALIILIMVIGILIFALGSLNGLNFIEANIFYLEGLIYSVSSVLLIMFMLSKVIPKQIKYLVTVASFIFYFITIYNSLIRLEEKRKNMDLVISDVIDSSKNAILNTNCLPSYVDSSIYYHYSSYSLLSSTLNKEKPDQIIYLTNDIHNYGTTIEPFYIIRNKHIDKDFSIDDYVTFISPFEPSNLTSLLERNHHFDLNKEFKIYECK